MPVDRQTASGLGMVALCREYDASLPRFTAGFAAFGRDNSTAHTLTY